MAESVTGGFTIPIGSLQTVELVLTTARSDTALITVATGSRIAITQISVTCSAANTANAGVRIGFGTANVPTVPSDGNVVAGMILTHPKIAGGSGVVLGNGSGVIALGADDQDVRVTNEVPTGGSMRVLATYFIVPS